MSEKDMNHNDEKYKGRIGILGGTFDPVHMGHVTLGQGAIEEAGLRKLIVMPAKVQPFKQDKEVTAEGHRLAMTRLAFQGMDKAEVSDYELKNTVISYTYDTLAYLAGIYPDDRLYFVMGTDSFLQLDSWHKGEDLLQSFHFAVSVRPGYMEAELEAKIQEYCSKYGAEVIKIHKTMPDISSTEIRQRLTSGESIEDMESMKNMLPEAVERYIEENGLYR